MYYVLIITTSASKYLNVVIPAIPKALGSRNLVISLREESLTTGQSK